ncbi:hypothetical protein, partial [Vibrio vulnificus]|uniref:hypothetical protein n=1 Tax=Vibrio vulnificus TaxID=672 RepID=UPI0005F11646
ALRGECRLNQLSANHFHHQNSPHTKNATRHESLLNALLCFHQTLFLIFFKSLVNTVPAKPKANHDDAVIIKTATFLFSDENETPDIDSTKNKSIIITNTANEPKNATDCLLSVGAENSSLHKYEPIDAAQSPTNQLLHVDIEGYSHAKNTKPTVITRSANSDFASLVASSADRNFVR